MYLVQSGNAITTNTKLSSRPIPLPMAVSAERKTWTVTRKTRLPQTENAGHQQIRSAVVCGWSQEAKTRTLDIQETYKLEIIYVLHSRSRNPHRPAVICFATTWGHGLKILHTAPEKVLPT